MAKPPHFVLSDECRDRIAERLWPFVQVANAATLCFIKDDDPRTWEILNQVRGVVAKVLYEELPRPVFDAIVALREGRGAPMISIENFPEREDLAETLYHMSPEEGHFAGYLQLGISTLLGADTQFKIQPVVVRGQVGNCHLNPLALHQDGVVDFQALMGMRGNDDALTGYMVLDEVERYLRPESLALLKKPLFNERAPKPGKELADFAILHDNGHDGLMMENFNLLRKARGLTAAADKALMELRRLTNDVEKADLLHLKPGQMVIIRNREMLHGRTGYEQEPLEERRWLQRILCVDEGVVMHYQNFTPLPDDGLLRDLASLKPMAFEALKHSMDETGRAIYLR